MDWNGVHGVLHDTIRRMSTALIVSLIVGAIVILGAFTLATIYNRLVSLRQRNLNAFSQIDVQLKRRHDLIPNLVEAVKGYMSHERQTLEAVTSARTAAVSAVTAASANPRDAMAIQSAANAENSLLAALGQLRVVIENYPQLKADQNSRQLMEELASTENRVAFARQAYNDSVMTYNTARQSFPANALAPMFGFQDAALFQIEDSREREVVGVSFDR